MAKKSEDLLVTTTFSNTKSMFTFFVAVFVLLGVFLLMHSYSTLVQDKTIQVKSEDDLATATSTFAQQVDQLETHTGELLDLLS